MIRFCDSEVGCARYELLDRSKLLSYFLAGHLDEIVCIYDADGAFMGIVTYHLLLNSISVEAAINKEYVILNDDIWRNARDIFKKKSRNIRDLVPLPVLDKDYQLICFAYQDEDANREIRMLRELCETEDALQFVDVFPWYKCVKIYGFNELAYFFADYLKNQNIPVTLEGTMWQGVFPDEKCEVPKYECLNIYAEGTWEKPRNWKENLLRSASVEFECVDRIYEENIKNNYITNADGDINVLVEHLHNEKEILICGTGMEAQDAYDFLIGNGIEPCGFVVNELSVESMHRLFGKKILGLHEAIWTYRNPVFIDCVSKNGAWGLGDVDYYDYLGYRRNESFITLRDYVEVPENNLLNVLESAEVVLLGNQFLCSKLYEYLMGKGILVKGYLHTLQKNLKLQNPPEILTNDISESVICLIVEPVSYSYAKFGIVGEKEKNQHAAYLRENNIDNFTDYFCTMLPFINVEKNNDIIYEKNYLMPKRVVLGSILYSSGNIFFRSLLDSHPHILSMDYCDLNDQLFWICMCLSTEKSENILPLFWKLINEGASGIVNQLAFNAKMKQLLMCSSKFTSQELFVMFHIAYMYMYGMDVTEDNISNMIIYWEPHYTDRASLERCVEWLGTEGMPCDVINIVRNSVSQRGSWLKDPPRIAGGVQAAYYDAILRSKEIPRKEHVQNNRLVIKFEDLKRNPREILQDICDRWDVPWSDTLLQTTQRGHEAAYRDPLLRQIMQRGHEAVYKDVLHEVSGFDLQAVYSTYENFFSEFDRFRIMLIDAPWLKKYGYPFAELYQFTREQLQEMFLKKFRFEDPGDITGFYKDNLGLDDQIVLQDNIRRKIQEARCLLSI